MSGLPALACLQLFLCMAVAWAAEPKVPAGRDPGGVAVAVIGGGLDYRREDIVARLARDGEGELIGWDFVDEDRRPFAASGGITAVAGLIVAESAARLVPVRVAAENQRQVAQALHLLNDMPARVALVAADLATPIERRNLALAAAQLAQVLIVVPARLVAPGSPGGTVAEEAAGLLVVSGSVDGASADIAIDRASRPGIDAEPGAAGGLHDDHAAAARVAALAARIIAKEQIATGRELRARILGLAKTHAGGGRTLSGIERLP